MDKQQQLNPSLKKRVFKASAWVFGGHLFSQGLRLCSNLIMTRLLVPEMFGIMAIANLLIFGLALFTDVGLNQNIIQSKRGRESLFLNTAWVIQILRGCLIWALTLLLAYGLYLFNGWDLLPIESVYAEPILPSVIAILSFTVLISGFNSTRLATANRDLNMRKVIHVEITSQLAAIVFMVCWAWVDRTIWALVAGSLLGSILKMYLSHRFLPGEKNALQWDQKAFVEIFHFGKWIFISSILGFFATSGDRLLLGGMVDSRTLGLYAIAFFMVNAIHQVAQKIIASVAFPALSEVVRERPEELKSIYYKFRLPVDILLLFITGLLFSLGHFLINILYDDRYHDAGYMLEILSIGLMQLRYSLSGQCYMAMGKPKLITPLIIIRLIGLWLLMPIAFQYWGLYGAIWLVVASVFFAFPVTLYLKIKYGLFDFRKELIVLPMLPFGFFIGEGVNFLFLN